MHVGVWLWGVALGVACVGAAAQPSSADDGDSSCVEVVVNGERTPAYDCLTRKLSPTLPARGPDDAAPGLASEAITQRPGNQLGLFNRAATGHRMGNTFGTSVHPQRPPPVVPTSPLLSPRR
ncbi:hypothetical protein [Variovorax sp. EBFNA2]|uniref:hypothetical protein n=1 Tax=Variovorax sp. EBFNA2 TaxID=3342097 RepID=UPI0029C0C2D8|nr:hypothetical protein [Variovorax boronicumulans]WPG35720.1 hypothetical protein RZE79_19750 [Variovorax boronicumulans]